MGRFLSTFHRTLADMTDTVSKRERSRIMAAVKSKDTAPEWLVRRLVHSLGYRYRLHVRSLPGTPDLVFPRLRKIINVNHCCPVISRTMTIGYGTRGSRLGSFGA